MQPESVLTSGHRDIEADVLRRVDGVDAYGQPSGEWEVVTSVWLSEEAVGRNLRASDRDQPSFSTEFVGLTVDLSSVTTSDILRVSYADYQIDNILRLRGNSGNVSMICSATQETVSLSTPGVPEDQILTFAGEPLTTFAGDPWILNA
jgi:hypothetical protein